VNWANGVTPQSPGVYGSRGTWVVPPVPGLPHTCIICGTMINPGELVTPVRKMDTNNETMPDRYYAHMRCIATI